jgi:hypothetical protein
MNMATPQNFDVGMVRDMLDSIIGQTVLPDMMPESSGQVIRARYAEGVFKFEKVRPYLDTMVQEHIVYTHDLMRKHDFRLDGRTPTRKEGRRVSRRMWQRQNQKAMLGKKKLQKRVARMMARVQEDLMSSYLYGASRPSFTRPPTESACKCRGVVCMCTTGMT